MKLFYHSKKTFLVDEAYKDLKLGEVTWRRWIWRTFESRYSVLCYYAGIRHDDIPIAPYQSLATPELWPLLFCALLNDPTRRANTLTWLAVHP